MKIISGFQTGADIAGIKAAKEIGIETGGYIPKGYITESGKRPDYKDLYNAIEHGSSNYLGRTLKNVLSSDCTIIFDYMQSSGSKKTKTYCQLNNKPYLYLNNVDIDNEKAISKIIDFLRNFDNDVIVNIAGNRESVAKGIEKKVYNILIKVLNAKDFNC